MDVDVGLLYHLRTHAVLSLEGMGCNLIKLAPSPSFAFPRLQIARKTQRRDLGACVSQKKNESGKFNEKCVTETGSRQ